MLHKRVNHGMQHGGYEAIQINVKAGQGGTSSDDGRKCLMGQRLGSNASVRTLQQVIYTGAKSSLYIYIKYI